MIRVPTTADVEALADLYTARYGIAWVPKASDPRAGAAGKLLAALGIIHGDAWTRYNSIFPASAPPLLSVPTCFLAAGYYTAEPMHQIQILAHEATHRAEAMKLANDGWEWVARYATDTDFRLVQEMIAYSTSLVLARAADPSVALAAPDALVGRVRANYGIGDAAINAGVAVAASLLAEIEAGGTISGPTRDAIALLGE